MHPLCSARRLSALILAALALALALALPAGAAAPAASSALQNTDGILLLPIDQGQILSVGNQTAGKCSLFALRYARTILDGKVSSGSGMWSGGAVWSAGGYVSYTGTLAQCLDTLYTELSAGRPVILHLQNTAVSGVSKHQNRVTTYEYHRTSSGWKQVDYPHISTSDAYGHWVCVVGLDPAADPANLKLSDFYALDPARVSANGTFALTRLLDGTLWSGDSPLKIAA